MGHVGIIGGGVVGLSAGLALLKAGHRVTLLDNDPGAAAPSWGNAGHIAVEQVAPLASMEQVRSVPGRLFAAGGPLALPPREIATWLPFTTRLLGASGAKRFAAGRTALSRLLAEALPAWRAQVEDIGVPDLLREGGHLVTWLDERAAREGARDLAAADTGTASAAPASAADLARLSALGAAHPAGAMRFTGTAQIADLDELRGALHAAFAARGGARIEGEGRLVREGRRISIAGVECDQVVVCAGVRSGALLAPVGHKVPLIAERGYHVRADAQHWPEDLPPVVYEERAMIVTRYRTCVQAASFVEFARADAPADPRKWARLERHIAELGLPITGPFQRWMGARPTLPDYLPAIGRSDRADNLYYAFGHQHLGLTLAAVTGRLVTEMLDGRRTSLPLAPFDLSRFA
ncbi:MAG: FAD-dependent oxidoreductase [Pseudomonadota bacterium]|uniref:NAD(P)/FAD-dependent oxidoreductase n=1 Tax=Novosphingobium sp. MBES04 TaxID=1206458 RepID=UPI0005806598|nr:FAD-dependent oxidoreductase [Novosphingobium sp. MBES04]MED5546432.1 FAD-dependent oxidoreductase [Pseudomonadota bacterium]GAM05227.1 FAD dependent oxidoreductase [Novosphingobium sp. MBES04]